MGEKRRRKRRQDRSTDIQVRFVNGIVEGWALPVGECFREALDIRFTDRVKKTDGTDGQTKRTERVWTQGVPPAYAFAVGDTIATAHFPPDGQDHHILIQVIEARADTWDAITGKIVPGYVLVQIYRPGAERRGWVKSALWWGSQTDFVAMLKDGVDISEEANGGTD